MSQGVLSPKEHREQAEYAYETYKIVDLLHKDINKIIEDLNKVKFVSEQQFCLRIAVRTAIDSIDAMIYRLKIPVRKLIKLRGVEKKLFSKPKKKGLIFTFKEFAVAFDSTFEIKEDDENYKDYLKARKIRDRITHPKKLADLNVLIDEYEKVVGVFLWFQNSFGQLIEKSKLSKKRKERST